MRNLFRAQTGENGRLSRTTGVSLLELSIAMGVGITLMAVLGRILIGTTNSLDYIVKDSVSVQDIEDTVTTIRDEIRDSKPSAITITTGTDNDTLTFQDSRLVGTTMDYGTEDSSGAWQSAWSVRYRVVGTNLVREVMNSGGASVSSSTVAQSLDTATGAPKGFSVIKNGNLYTVLITINKTFSDQKTYTKTMQGTVLVTN
jgi:hypothetical protein